MTIKEQLYYLLEKYHDGEYDTKTFADQFDYIYAHGSDEANFIQEEHELFYGVFRIVGRHSPFKDDHEKYPGVYYTDEDVRKIAEDVFWKTRKFRKNN